MWNIPNVVQMRTEKKELLERVASLQGDVGRLTIELSEMTEKAVKLEQTLGAVEVQRKYLSGRVDELTADVKKLRKTVREQTAADLLVNALEAVGIIKNDNKPDFDYQARATQLQAQQNALRQGAGQGPLAGLGAGYTGLGGILGEWS